MISRIKGRIKAFRELSVLIDTGGITYEVLIPPALMKSVKSNGMDEIELVTYHYYQTDLSKSMPVLIGFMNEIEKEFFEKFISVSGVGPKAACKALAEPFSTIAEAIDSADTSLLKTLPGIGEQKAREIIAKLQGRVGKFGLIQDKDTRSPKPAGIKEDVREGAMSVLMQLQYKKKEADDMLEKAIRRNPDIKTSEDLLNEVYRQRTREKG